MCAVLLSGNDAMDITFDYPPATMLSALAPDFKLPILASGFVCFSIGQKWFHGCGLSFKDKLSLVLAFTVLTKVW